MKKLKNLGQLLMALVITITSVFGNTFVVFADTNPNAGKVTATKTAERIGDETSRSAKVKITVSGNPYTITEQSDREIVLVLDSSGSMKDYLVNADLIIYVVDSSTPLDENDEKIMEMIKDRTALVLLNKSDLDTVTTEEMIASHLDQKIIKVSMKENQGVDELENAIKELFFHGKV